jgi:DNA repair protein RecN (Recombination protein N)
MLTELRIQDLAIIDRLELEFGPGLIILTGETGAGKSIILDAVEMMLGGRADATIVRAEAERTSVEGVFKLEGVAREGVNEILKREELLDEPDYMTLAREIRREGRSIARVNGRTVSVALLKEIGDYLVDVHGQTEHFSLHDPRAHLGLLDRFAGLDPALASYRKTYSALQGVRRALDELRKVQADAAQRTEMLTFQAEEIEAAQLKSGEEEDLKQERDRLANAEHLATLAQEALLALDESTPESSTATDLLGTAAKALDNLARIDKGQAALSERAALVLENVSDVVRELRRYVEVIEFNPKRLEDVEERLDLIYHLQRKYGGSIESAVAAAEKARAELETISNAAGKIAELETEQAALVEKITAQAAGLSEQRKTAAEKLGRSVEVELDDLKMSGSRFDTDFQTRPDPNGISLEGGEKVAFDATGCDRVEFLVAPNPGEGLKPLAKIASGGETSRLMLAIKHVLARADQIPTLIFDEIDQGIGGRVGGVVGQKLWALGREHQVMCITHLPQLAAYGDQHFQVQKLSRDGRTVTAVQQMKGNERMLELAGMLGEVSEGTLQSAMEILQAAKTAKG